MSGFLLNPFILATPAGGGSGGGVYATGGTVVDITGYKVHIFNATSTFATTSDWPSGRTIEYLVVAGGGGSNIAGGGGGGAGGLLTASGTALSGSTNYAVTVGGAGAASTNGGDSSLIGGAISIISKGGGGATTNDGQNGGSGAGGGWVSGGESFLGGKGVYPGSTYLSQARQGYDGESGSDGKRQYSGAGGGASSTGGFGPTPSGNGVAGDGLVSNMLSFYTASSMQIPAYPGSGSDPGGSNFDYTFAVAAGLPFKADDAIYLSNTTNPLKAMWGKVTSYSGTTLVCRLSRYNNSTCQYPNGVQETLSGWNIYFAHAGGGSYVDEQSTTSPSRLGGGGGYDDALRNGGLPNSGGGGYSYVWPDVGLDFTAGGSGRVMIKYAYP
jgi:hypothetical protein